MLDPMTLDKQGHGLTCALIVNCVGVFISNAAELLHRLFMATKALHFRWIQAA